MLTLNNYLDASATLNTITPCNSVYTEYKNYIDIPFKQKLDTWAMKTYDIIKSET